MHDATTEKEKKTTTRALPRRNECPCIDAVPIPVQPLRSRAAPAALGFACVSVPTARDVLLHLGIPDSRLTPHRATPPPSPTRRLLRSRRRRRRGISVFVARVRAGTRFSTSPPSRLTPTARGVTLSRLPVPEPAPARSATHFLIFLPRHDTLGEFRTPSEGDGRPVRLLNRPSTRGGAGCQSAISSC